MKSTDLQRRRVASKKQKRRTRASRHSIVPFLEALEIRVTLSSTPVRVPIYPSQNNTLYEAGAFGDSLGSYITVGENGGTRGDNNDLMDNTLGLGMRRTPSASDVNLAETTFTPSLSPATVDAAIHSPG